MSGSPLRKARRACRRSYHLNSRIKTIDGKRWCETCQQYLPGEEDLNEETP